MDAAVAAEDERGVKRWIGRQVGNGDNIHPGNLKAAEVAWGGLRSEYGGGTQNCRSLAQDIASFLAKVVELLRAGEVVGG